MKNVPQFIKDFCDLECITIEEYIENSKQNYVILQGGNEVLSWADNDNPIVYGELGEEINSDLYLLWKDDKGGMIITLYDYLTKYTDFEP